VPDQAPPKKPKNYTQFLDMLNTKQAVKMFSPKTYVNLVGEFSKKAYDNGELSEKEYMEIVRPLFGDAGIMASKKIQEEKDYLEKYADGGRVNYNSGSQDPEISRLRERIIEIMDIEKVDFGEAYEQAKRELSRENNSEGTMPKSEKWMRDYFFSGKGGYDDRMSYQEFAIGPGQELFKRFNKKNGGVIYGKYAKQLLSS
jgi:hypothetical protein